MIDLKEIGPTYYFAPPRIFEGLLTSVMIRMEDAGAIKRKMFHSFMDPARRRPARATASRSAPRPAEVRHRRLPGYGPLRNNLGMSRVRVAYTAGEAIGPDLFTFYRAIGINLKQLYGSTETAVFVCMQPDNQVHAGPRWARPGRAARDATPRSWCSPGLLKEYYKNPQATAEVKDQDGWYHTGDAGFLDARGT